MASMRARTFLLLAVFPSTAFADTRPSFPSYDIQVFCKAQVSYSFAATLGDSSFDGVYAACVDRERENKTLAQGHWSNAAPKFALQCADLADGRYTYLARCLDGE